MANNCSVTRFLGATNNPNLPMLDAIVFNVTQIENPTSATQVLSFKANGKIKIKTSDGGSFLPAGEAEYVNEKTYTLSSLTTIIITLYNGNYKLYIQWKQNIQELFIDSSEKTSSIVTPCTFDVSQLYYMSSLNKVRLLTIPVTGVIDFENWANIQELYIAYDNQRANNQTTLNVSELNSGTNLTYIWCSSSAGNIFGSIEELTSLTQLADIRFVGCNRVTGELANLCDSLYNNGKISGKIKFYLNGTQCTYNGNTIDSVIVVTFSSEGWSAL